MGAISSGNANVKQTISNVIILFNSNENKHRFCFSPGSWRTQPTPRTHVRFRLLPPSVWTLGARVLVSALRATGCAHPAPPQPNPTHSAHGGCCNWVLSIQSSTLFALRATGCAHPAPPNPTQPTQRTAAAATGCYQFRVQRCLLSTPTPDGFSYTCILEGARTAAALRALPVVVVVTRHMQATHFQANMVKRVTALVAAHEVAPVLAACAKAVVLYLAVRACGEAPRPLHLVCRPCGVALLSSLSLEAAHTRLTSVVGAWPSRQL
jgi:hypothetical protein